MLTGEVNIKILVPDFYSLSYEPNLIGNLWTWHDFWFCI